THLFTAYDINQINADRSDFLAEFQRAQSNMTICNANLAACKSAQASAGISSSNQTGDNFANFGLAGQVPVNLMAGLIGGVSSSGAVSLSSSAWRGANATAVKRGGLADLAARADTTLLTSRVCVGGGNCLPANYFRPNPQFGQIFYFDSNGDSYYHGLIAQIRRRFEKGLEVGFAYTYSRSIDDLSVDPV